MTEATCFWAGFILGGLLVGAICWGIFWMVAHPGCLVKFEEWAKQKQKEKYEKVAKKYD